MTKMTQPADTGAQPAPALQPEALRIAMHLRQRANLSRPGNLDTLSTAGANELERQHAELSTVQSEAKHWRTNHDNVVARLRIFTQRPDIPKELADRLPWYRELVRLQEVEAQALPSVVVGPLAERGILDAIRSGYDLGYNDARSARAVPGDSAPGYKGRQVEGDHGGALVHLLKKLQAAPPAPAAVAVPVEDMRDKVTLALGLSLAPKGGPSFAWSYLLDSIRELVKCEEELVLLKAGQEMSKARAALAAAPAQAQDDRAAFKAYLQECDDCEIVPDVAGAFHAAWQKRAAPAQAVASSITIDFKQAAELLEMFGGEPAEITLMMGDGHSGNGLYASYTDMPEEGAGFLGKPDNEALPAAPAQEHATQLAGQVLPADEFRGDTASLVRNIVALLDLDAQGCLVPHGVGGHARGLLSAAASRLAAAPVQPQEDTRDPVRALIATHAEMLEDNAYAYFELAYTRQTGWMAWITDKPLYGAPVVNPDRKVLANGQGDTPDEACAAAARAAQGDTK